MKELNTEITCVCLGGVHVIPMTSSEIAREFLKQYNSIFVSRPLTMATEYSTCGFKTIALVPWKDQWKKMRKVVASNVINPTTLHWLLHKRTEEADNLVRFIRNKFEKSTSVVDVRLAIHHYCGNVMRKMIFNKQYFRKGSNDGGPEVEEVEHVESLWSLLTHIYAFVVSDYIPCLRALDLDGHEKMVSEAIRIVSSYEEAIIDERVEMWRDGKKEAEDLLDALILAVEEIKA
jgi:phenylalanine N-monooxygenase